MMPVSILGMSREHKRIHFNVTFDFHSTHSLAPWEVNSLPSSLCQPPKNKHLDFYFIHHKNPYR